MIKINLFYISRVHSVRCSSLVVILPHILALSDVPPMKSTRLLAMFFCLNQLSDRVRIFVRDPLEADWSSFVARACGFVEQSGFMLNECVRVS